MPWKKETFSLRKIELSIAERKIIPPKISGVTMPTLFTDRLLEKNTENTAIQIPASKDKTIPNFPLINNCLFNIGMTIIRGTSAPKILVMATTKLVSVCLEAIEISTTAIE